MDDIKLTQHNTSKLISVSLEYDDHIWKISGELAEDWLNRVNAVCSIAGLHGQTYFDDFPFDNAEIIGKTNESNK